MLSQFASWDDTQKRLFIAKIIHQINYSQANLELMESILSIWQKYPTREAYFFQETSPKNLNYGTITNN
jgi:hypothetical protein